LDADKQQWQIDLTVLPPGVTKNLIKAGQQWFIQRTTTYNRLLYIVGTLDTSVVDFRNRGDLLVGSGFVSATILPIGSTHQVLGVVGGTAEWINVTSVSGVGGGIVDGIVAGAGISVNSSNPAYPIVTATSSGGGGSIASLSGPGLTASPGQLVQSGGFTVNDATGVGVNITTSGGITIKDNEYGIFLEEYGFNGIQINNQNPGGLGVNLFSAGGITLFSEGGTIIQDTSASQLVISGSDIVLQAPLMGFFGVHPGVSKQVSGGTLAGVISGLVALGLFSS
jgi:hypothetical protein